MLAEITDDISTEIKMTKLQIRRLRRELANAGTSRAPARVRGERGRMDRGRLASACT